MARVPLIDDEIRPELADLCDRLRAGRRGSLINVYKILLNSPEMAEAWLGYMNAVRWGTSLSGRLREIVTIRIAYLNDVPYVLGQHVPKLAEAEGLSVAECNALADWTARRGFHTVTARQSITPPTGDQFDHRDLPPVYRPAR